VLPIPFQGSLPALFTSAGRSIAIVHVTVIDPDDPTPRKDTTVLIANGIIQTIGPSVHIHIRENTTVVDGRGKFLIPGLWDMHVHSQYRQRDFAMYIANGVLGVRNMGGRPEEVFREREDTREGKVLGPAILACGPILDGPRPVVPGISLSLHSPQEAREAIDRLKIRGADFIKVYDGLPRDVYFAVAQEARRLDISFAGHVPAEIRVHEALEAGQKSIEHGAALRGASSAENEVVAHGSSVLEKAARAHDLRLIPEAIAKDGNLILDHYTEARAVALYKDFVRHDAYLTPTLVAERSLTFVDEISRTPDTRLRFVPKETQEGWKPQAGFLSRYRTPEYITFRKREYAVTKRAIFLAQKTGVSLLAGTDVTLAYIYPGFSLHDELKLMVEAGLTPAEAMRTATTAPERFFHLENGLGTVKAGSEAGLLLLDANPLADITNIDKVDTVFLHGAILTRSTLDKLLHDAERSVQ
jgi:hypothetical protein